MEAVWVALIVAVAAMAGPLLLARQQNRRQDEVARRVTDVADKLAAQNKVVAQATKTTNTKIDDVHQIVNQQRTDMVARIDELKNALIAGGLPIPPDATHNPGGSP
jgi:uncharacterized protein YlxW (UPF0749 family)